MRTAPAMGRTPRAAQVPLDPQFIHEARAGGGVGAESGGPPHNQGSPFS
jgi:hypothetical protein